MGMDPLAREEGSLGMAHQIRGLSAKREDRCAG